MIASHSHSLSAEFGGRVRDIVGEFGQELTGVRLAKRSAPRDDWKTDQGGGLFATSAGTSPSGRGYDLVVADDCVKDFAKAASPTARRALSVWFHGELLSRKQPGGKCVVVLSRRHPSDLAGELEALNPDLPPSERWTVVRHPALDEQGQPLWPQQWPAERLEATRHRYEIAGLSHLWHAEYQQSPTADALSLEWPDDYFDGILYDELPPGTQPDMRVLACDPSKGTNSKSGDYAAFADVLLDHQRHLWVRPSLHRMTSDQIEDTLVEMARTTRYSAVFVEGNSSGAIMATNAQRKAKARGVHLPIYCRDSTTDKVVRIRLALTPLLHQHRIHIHAGSKSSALAVTQLREFPSGAHDDFPDALTMACDLINELKFGRAA